MSLEVRDVTAGYPGVPVLQDVSFTVEGGEWVSVLGVSGSGKTTLLRVIAGLHRPDSGRVLADGDDLTEVPVERRRIGLVPQEGALFPHRTVAGNVGYGLRAGPARAGRVAELLELVDLAGYARSMPHELSGGQRQRVALARALAPAPRVLLLDEPFASLDVGLRAHVRAETARVLRATGTTALLITHDVQEALTLSDRLVVLDGGRVLACGAPRALWARPPTTRVVELLGCGRVVPGTLEDDGARVRTALGGHPVDVAPAGPSGGAVRVLIRPDDLRVVAVEAAAGPAHGPRVLAVEFEGRTELVLVEIPGLGVLQMTVPPGSAPAVGSRVRVEVSGPVTVLPS